MIALVQTIHLITQLLSITIIVNSVLSFILSPYHPVRVALDRLLNPLMQPIRRFVPSTGGFDFSPLILLVIIQVLDSLITGLLLSL